MRIASAHTPHHTTPERNLEAPRRPPTQPRAPAEAKEGEGIVSAAGRILARPGWEVEGGRTGHGDSIRGGREGGSEEFLFRSICDAANSEWSQKTFPSYQIRPFFSFTCLQHTQIFVFSILSQRSPGRRHPPVRLRVCPRPSLVSSPEQIRGLLGAKISPRAPIGRRRMT